MEEIKFEKRGNRFLMSPIERIIKILKLNKEMSITSLYRLAKVQYYTLEKFLTQLDKEGKVVIIKTTQTDDEGNVILVSKQVKWREKEK